MNATPSPLKGKTILVVDDEADLRNAIAFEFKRRGCHVLEAECGNQAVDLILNTHQVDMIISDVRMPNGTGIEMLVEIRKLDPHVPVVLLVTGYADLTEVEAQHKGACGLLSKPIDRKQMIALVEKAISQSSQKTGA